MNHQGQNMERKIRKSVVKYLPLLLINAFLPALFGVIYPHIDSYSTYYESSSATDYDQYQQFLTVVGYLFKLIISVFIILDLKRNGFASYWVGLIGMLSLTFGLTLVLLTSFTPKEK